MNQHIAHLSLLVRDYDEAISFYTQKLDFELVEDTPLSSEKRWVLVKPKGSSTFSILLAKAADEIQEAAIGNQSGGRVFLFLYTDDFWKDYRTMISRGIQFVRQPESHSYGIVAVFADLYGNLWDLLQPKNIINTSHEDHLLEKIDSEVDSIWAERNLSQSDLDEALLTHRRTKY